MKRVRLYHIWQNMGDGSYQRWKTTTDEKMVKGMCSNDDGHYVYTIEIAYCGADSYQFEQLGT